MNFEYPKNIRFLCNGCALCCGDTDFRVRTIVLLEAEAAQISKATLKDIPEFAEKKNGLHPYAYLMRKDGQGKCFFLKEKRCSIYEIRPLVCEFYPFELMVSEYGKYVFNYTCECPNVGKGHMVQKSVFEKLFRKSSEMLSSYQHKENMKT